MRIPLGALIVVVALGAPALGATIDWTYEANVMPTSDGWVFGDNPGYEAGHVFIESPGVLRINDLDTFGGSATWYRQSFTNAAEPYYAGEVTAQAIAGNNNNWFLLRSATHSVGLNLNANDSVSVLSATSTTVNTPTTDAFHTYRAELTGSTYNVYRDNVLIDSGTALAGGGVAEIQFGMNSSALTGQWRVDQIRALSGASAVPEPSTWLLLLLSGGLLGLRRARR